MISYEERGDVPVAIWEQESERLVQGESILAELVIAHLVNDDNESALLTTHQQIELAERLGDSTAAACLAAFATMMLESGIGSTPTYRPEAVKELFPKRIIGWAALTGPPPVLIARGMYNPGIPQVLSWRAAQGSSQQAIEATESALLAITNEEESEAIANKLSASVERICMLAETGQEYAPFKITRGQKANLLMSALKMAGHFKTLSGLESARLESISLQRILESVANTEIPYETATKPLVPVVEACIDQLVAGGDDAADIELRESFYLGALKGYCFLAEYSGRDHETSAEKLIEDRPNAVDWLRLVGDVKKSQANPYPDYDFKISMIKYLMNDSRYLHLDQLIY